MASFESAHDFRKFSNVVRRERRFFYTGIAADFLAGVRSTVETRQVSLKSGKILWRAQIGSRPWYRTDDEGHEWTEEAPFLPERMKPLAHHTFEGRANPRGISFLYLATDHKTAICEVRPWVGALLSVGRFVVSRDMNLADFTRHKGKLGAWDILLNLPIDRLEKLTADEIQEAVWADVDRAFAQPVGPQDEHTHYVPTQIIAEFIRQQGFDGIAYRSAMNEEGFNVALFDLDAASLTACHLFEIQKISYQHEEATNPWFVENDRYVTNVITGIRPLGNSTSNKG